MLDEMTAALPADLTEKVLEVVGRQRGGDGSIIFISHRMIEIAAVCDRATVLREGETVGVVDVTAGSEEPDRRADARRDRRRAAGGRRAHGGRPGDRDRPRIEVRGLAAEPKLRDATFELHPGEVLGVVALEGQGQDELFDVLCGAERPSGGELLIDGSPVSFRHPADAIRAGVVYVAADRAEALLMQRSVRENIALPFTARIDRWGLIDLGRERQVVDGAIDRLQIDARAGREVRRLSGGNQQKVTIARWVAGGVRTMLCFDPTRGIDIRTKQQIYVLLRDLAEAGAAVLFYTSDLKEVSLVCDRSIVLFGGQVVAEISAADAGRASAAAGGLQPHVGRRDPRARRSRGRGRRGGGRRWPRPSIGSPNRRPSPTSHDRQRPMPAATTRGPAGERGRRTCRDGPGEPIQGYLRDNAWALSLVGFLVLVLLFTKLIQPSYGVTGIQGLAVSVLPLALAAVAQAVVVISGGIDLSIGSMMALTSVVAASQMKGQSNEVGVAIAIGVLLLGLVLGAVNGGLIVLTRVPDIVVTLAMSFVWAGCALLVLRTPGGGAAPGSGTSRRGYVGIDWIPPSRLSSSSSSCCSSGSPSADPFWGCRCTQSAATSWRPSGAASPSGG